MNDEVREVTRVRTCQAICRAVYVWGGGLNFIQSTLGEYYGKE